jgi:hypothetical protein
LFVIPRPLARVDLYMFQPWSAALFARPAVLLLAYAEQSDNILNILTAVVFGFSGLNILNLVSRRFDPRRRDLSFGEVTAIAVVFLALGILAWEFLHLFRIFPIKLRV